MKCFKQLTILFGSLLILAANSAQADFGDGGKWKMGPFGPTWDDNSWPEFTPMYWMEEMANEFDNNDNDFNPYAGRANPFGDNMLRNGPMRGPNGGDYRDWYDDDDWPEWTPMYWMEEFSNAFDNDDDNWNDRLNRYQAYRNQGYRQQGDRRMPANSARQVAPRSNVQRSGAGQQAVRQYNSRSAPSAARQYRSQAAQQNYQPSYQPSYQPNSQPGYQPNYQNRRSANQAAPVQPGQNQRVYRPNSRQKKDGCLIR